MLTRNRLRFSPVAGAETLFNPQFVEYLVALHDKFTKNVHFLRTKRTEILKKALVDGILPTYLPLSEINTSDWQIPPVPDDLRKPGIEITGPASITGMFINGLNPGPDGYRAEGVLDDDEDASGCRFINTVTATHNRLAAVRRNLSFTNPQTGKHYEIKRGILPFFMHRERGLHLDEPEVLIDNQPIPAAILGTALTLFHAGRAQIERNQGVYFYIPKLESAEEAGFWKKFFDFSSEYLTLPGHSVIRAIPLVESLPFAYQMEEALHALGPYAAGLNAARWDFKASVLEFVMSNPDSVWPDRFGIDIKTTEFLSTIFKRLVAICLKRGAVPIGGMATALPSQDPKINEVASESIRTDKQWEAEQGFLRGWVAHIFHMHTASTPFKKLRESCWKPTPEMANPANYPITIKVPDGPITIEGARQNARMLIEYLEGWLNGKGAKGIDSLAGKPGKHPLLMEDLATGRISVAQLAQRILHHSPDSKTGQCHDLALVKMLLEEEVTDILIRFKKNMQEPTKKNQIAFAEMEKRYRMAVKIAMRWIKNYTELNFRSLASYTKAELDIIGKEQSAF